MRYDKSQCADDTLLRVKRGSRTAGGKQGVFLQDGWTANGATMFVHVEHDRNADAVYKVRDLHVDGT